MRRAIVRKTGLNEKAGRGSGGFTLVDAVVALAVSGVVLFGAASVFTMITRVSQNAHSLADARGLESLIKQQLANSNACMNILPPGYTLSSIAPGTSNSVDLYKYPSSSSTVFIGHTPASSPTNNVYGGITVNSLALDIVSAARSRSPGFEDVIGNLHLTIQKNSVSGGVGAVGAITDMKIPISMAVKIPPPYVVAGCAAIGSSAENQITPPQCTSDNHLVLDYTNPANPQWICQ